MKAKSQFFSLIASQSIQSESEEVFCLSEHFSAFIPNIVSALVDLRTQIEMMKQGESSVEMPAELEPFDESLKGYIAVLSDDARLTSESKEKELDNLEAAVTLVLMRLE